MGRLGKKNIDSPQSITEGVIWQQLLVFFFPILLGTFFQQLYNTADAIIVGKFVGTGALAAVGSTGSLINLIVGFFMGLASGATVIVSQFYGARQEKDVSRTVHTAMAFALVGGLFLSVVGYAISPALLHLMGTPEDIMPGATSYIRIYFLGMIPMLIYNIGAGVLRAIGDSRRPLNFLIAASLFNIVMDILLVLGADMGVAGAAWATTLSQFFSAILVLTTLLRSQTSYQLHVKKIRFHGDIMKDMVRIGLPAGLQSVMYSISNVIIQSTVNSFGTDVIAAWTAFGKLDAIFWMIISAFGISITTFAGQNFGARKYDRMKKSVHTCLAMSFGATVLIIIFMLLLGRPLYGMFTDDSHVLELGMEILQQLAPFWLCYVCIEIYSGALRGAGDSFLPTLFTLVGVCLLRVAWLLFIVPGSGSLRLTLYCYPITWSITSVMFLVYYYKSSWLKRSMKKYRHDQALPEE